ncbi:hypothetical protein [Chondrinema litorale]|uniref:hypothetical protein n=1 Tax=Chondrinema litorale TaxID=2994555 RepID=UPI00254375AC|nr:hypothetical protein [Chondrinema litorale]UZR99812.1 hypothetical protein OQ292_38570 [Chondrinema litorale]
MPSFNFAQDNELEDKIIEDEAIKLIVEYESMLNQIIYVSSDLEKKMIIKNSYSNESGNQIFENKNVIIESDLDPQNAKSNLAIDLDVPTYLNKYWLLFQRENNLIAPIEFNNVHLDTIYKNKKLAEVSYDCLFHGKHINRDSQYEKYARTAIIKIEKADRWKLLISGISFNNPLEIKEEENTMRLQSDSLQYINYNQKIETPLKKELTNKEKNIAGLTGLILISIAMLFLSRN